jgi:hypothetical protein
MSKHESAFDDGGVEPTFGHEAVGMDDDDNGVRPATAAPATDAKVSKEQKQACCHSSGGKTWLELQGRIDQLAVTLTADCAAAPQRRTAAGCGNHFESRLHQRLFPSDVNHQRHRKRIFK